LISIEKPEVKFLVVFSAREEPSGSFTAE